MAKKRIWFVIIIVVVLSCLVLILNKSTKGPRTVGIIEPIVHIAVSDITKGIQDGLNTAAPGKFKVLVKNASSETTSIPMIIAGFRDAGVRIFVPIFTSTAQATKNNVGGQYIVFAAVTDPVAADLLKDPNKPEDNITGVSDLWPIAAQFELIKEIVPNFKTMGILFDPNDPSSAATMPLIRENAGKAGVSLVEKPVHSTMEVAEALPILRGKVDCIFTANDVTVTKSFPALVSFAIANKIPLFAGDYSSVQRGAIGAVGQSYYNVGLEAANLIVAIESGKPVSSLPVRFTQGGDLYLNMEAARKMGIKIPEQTKRKAKEVYEKISEENKQNEKKN